MRENMFYKVGATVLFILVALIITFMVLGKKQSNKIAEKSNEEPAVVSSSNVIEDSNEIKNLNELQEINDVKDSKATSNSESANTSNKNVAQKTEENVNKSTANANSSDKEDTAKETATTVADPTFCYPVEGEISMEYAKDKLVYSNTLGEWITHPGVDINAAKTTVVKAAADGCIKSIKNDPRYGLTVVIEHVNGYTSIYSNLLTAEFVNVGEKVTQGQTIGTVGNTASFEILEESHLHFEITKDGEQIDPTMYLKN